MALQIVNHLQDIKYDLQKLNRVYLPADMMREYGVSQTDLQDPKSTPELKALINHISELVRGQLKEGEILPQLVRSKRLRYQLYIILSLTNIMLKKINKGDVLASEVRLNKWNWLCGVCRGILQGLFCRSRVY